MVTRTTLETPSIAWSILSGEPRSPGKISTPVWARSAAFSGWRTTTRTGTSRWAIRRAAAEPTLPAVLTRITSSPPFLELTLILVFTLSICHYPLPGQYATGAGVGSRRVVVAVGRPSDGRGRQAERPTELPAGVEHARPGTGKCDQLRVPTALQFRSVHRSWLKLAEHLIRNRGDRVWTVRQRGDRRTRYFSLAGASRQKSARRAPRIGGAQSADHPGHRSPPGDPKTRSPWRAAERQSRRSPTPWPR